jgi:Flp pilus assembly protein TadD
MPDDIDRLLNNGLRFHREGRLDEARGIYQQILRERPDFARAHHMLGLATRHLGNEAEANRHFRQAARLEPTEILYRATLADSHRALGDLAAARTELESIESLPLDDPDLRIQIATQWGLIGDSAAALARCRPVIDLFPDHPQGNLLLGTLLHDRGDYADAVAPLEVARNAGPPLPDPSCALASTLLILGRRDRVLALRPPNDPRQMFGEGTLKATALWLEGRADEAARFADAARSHGATLGDWPKKGAFQATLDHLAGLVAYRERHAPTYRSAAHATLPVIGDEQALAAAGYVINWAGQATRLVAEPVYGCRAKHLASDANRFKAAYLLALDRIAGADRFVSFVGDLDCRITGLLAELPVDEKGRWSDFTAVDRLAEDYVAWLDEASKARGLRPIVMGVPATNIQVDVMKDLARRAFLNIIERFNRALATAAARHGMPFADLLAATRSQGAQARPVLYINASMLLPTAIANALDACVLSPTIN